jgi:hypothetical protein
MAANPRLQEVQKQIEAQGLTREQAMGKYALSPQDADWMSQNLGLRFASGAPKPAALMNAGAPQTMTAPATASASTYKPPTAATPGAAQATASGYTATGANRAAGVAAPNADPVARATGRTATAAGNVQAGAATARNATATDARASVQGPAAVYNAAQANAAQYNATRGSAATYTPDTNSTVQGQLANIVDSGSPLMEMAETRGLQQANKRGLMHSSMAVQSGQAALYDAALPIAQQDATTFGTAQRDNTENRQEMELANTGATNRSREFNAGNRQETRLANAGATNASRQFNANERNDMSSHNADLRTQVSLANAGARTDTSRFNAGNATDVSKFNVDKSLQAGIVNQEQANRIRTFNADLMTRVNLSNTTSANDFQKFLLDQQLQAGIINQQQYNEMSKFNASEANDAKQLNATLQSDIAKFNASESNDLTALGMDNNTRLQLGTLEANYKVLMQTQAGAGDLYKQYLGSIAQVLQNKDLDGNAKNNAINTLVSGLNGSLDVMGDLANMNIPELVFDEDAGGGGGGGGGTGGTGGTTGGNAGTANNGFTFPNTISGVGTVNWNQTDITGRTLIQQYDSYAVLTGATALSPEEWLRRQPAQNGGATGDGSGDDGSASAGSATSGDSGGISI